MVFNQAAKKLLEAAGPVKMVAHDWWMYQLVTATGGIVHYDPQPCLKYRQHARNVIGSRVGLDALVHRFFALLPRRKVEANDIHINALLSLKKLLLPRSVNSVELFAAARKAFLLERFRLLQKSGVYRQGIFENTAMFLGIIWGDIPPTGTTVLPAPPFAPFLNQVRHVGGSTRRALGGKARRNQRLKRLAHSGEPVSARSKLKSRG